MARRIFDHEVKIEDLRDEDFTDAEMDEMVERWIECWREQVELEEAVNMAEELMRERIANDLDRGQLLQNGWLPDFIVESSIMTWEDSGEHQLELPLNG